MDLLGTKEQQKEFLSVLRCWFSFLFHWQQVILMTRFGRARMHPVISNQGIITS